MVAGVEDADEFVVGFEEGVGFVDHECGPEFFNGAVEGRRADVGRDEWAIDETRKDSQEGRFAAASDG